MPGYDEFVDPNSAIARIIAQMQGAATRSNPGIGPEEIQRALPPGGAQPPREAQDYERYMQNSPSPYDTSMQGEMGPEDPNELIARLLQSQMGR